MKKILLVLVLYSLLDANVSYIQGNSVTGNGSATSIKIGFPGAVTAGNSLILDVHSYGSNTSHTVSDKLSNTVSLVDTVYYSTQTEKISRWRVKFSSSGVDTFTVTFGTEISYYRSVILEYSGLDTSTLYYDTKDSINASLAENNETGKVKVSAVGDLVLSTIQSTCTGQYVTAGSGFTMRQSTSGGLNLYIEDFISVNTDSIMGKWTNSASSGTCWLSLTTSFRGIVIPDSGTFALTDITANRIFQRQTVAGIPGGTQCSVTVAGRCKKYTTAIKALIRHTDNDTVINWTTIATSPDSGNFSKKISVPNGCWYKVSICDNLNDTVHGSNRFGVGDVWLIIGQSNIMGWVNNIRGNANDTASDSVVNFSRLTWQRLIDPMLTGHGATPFIKIGNMLVTKTGYPQAFVNTAIGGTSLNGDWNDRHLPLSDTSYKYNRAYTYAQLSGGKIYGIIMGQGERDAEIGTNKQTYMDAFDTIITRFRSDLSFSNLPIFYFQVGRFEGYTTDANIAVIQDAQLSMESHSRKLYLSTVWWDLPMDADKIHLSVAGNDTLGARFGKSICRWYEGTILPYPKITTIENSGKTVIKITTTADKLATISQLPNFVVTHNNGDTVLNIGIKIDNSIFYDTTNISKREDSLKASYSAQTVPPTTYVLKDTGGFPLPQVWGPVLFNNNSSVPVIDSIAPTHGISGTAIRLYGDFATGDTVYIDGVRTLYNDSTTFLYLSVPTHLPGAVNIIVKNTSSLTDTIAWTYDHANRVWSSSASTNANDSANYTGSGLLLSTDTLSLNNTSAVNWTATGNLSCSKLIANSNYVGNMSLGTYVLTTTNGGAIFNGTGALNLGAGITSSGASDSVKIASGGTVTATNAVLSFSGATPILVDNKGMTNANRLSLSNSVALTNSGSATTKYVSALCPFTMGNNDKLLANRAMTVIRTTSGDLIKTGTNDSIQGTGNLLFSPGANSIIDTIWGFTKTGNGYIDFSDYGNGSAVTNVKLIQVGNILGSSNIYIGYGNYATTSFIYKNMNNNVTCGVFACGNFAGASIVDSLGNGTYNFTAWTPYLNAASKICLQGGTYNCSGSWTDGAKDTIDAGTSTINILNTSTVTTGGQTYNNFICNAAGKTITMVGKFRCLGDFTVTAGKPVFASLARDSIGGSYVNALTGTDTVNRNSDSMWIGGSFTGNLRVKNDLSRTYLYGTAICNFTSNGTTVNYFDIRGTDRTKQQKLIDRYHGRKQVITTGTFNTNGMDAFCDSLFICNDSIATLLGDTISAQKITFGASAKPSLTVPMQLFFGLALKDTLFDTCARSLGKLTENKTGDTLTLSGVTHLDTLQVVDGYLRMRSAIDTVYTKALSWTSTDPSTIIAPIIVTDSIYVAAGASITYSGVGRIINLSCKAAQGGNAARIYYPTIAPISYASAPWADAVGKTSTHAITIGGCSLGRDSIVKIGTWPAGYTINASTGLVSWDGTGSAQAAGNYVVRAYSNSKTDSASVAVSIAVISSQKSTEIKHFRFGFGFRY